MMQSGVILLIAIGVTTATPNGGWGQNSGSRMQVASQQYGSSSYGGSSYGGSSYGGNSYGGSSTRGSYGQQNVAITSFDRTIASSGDRTQYTSSNGINQGHIVNVVPGTGWSSDDYGRQVQTNKVINMNGWSAYTSPEGKQVSLTWNAGQQGFQPQGDHLPRSVELPADHKEIWRLATGMPLQIA